MIYKITIKPILNHFSEELARWEFNLGFFVILESIAHRVFNALFIVNKYILLSIA